MNVTDRPGRVRLLPYLFGALLGVSLGLIIISGVLFFKNSKGTERGRSSPPQDAGSYAAALPASTGTIADDRRNAIVVATEKAAPAVVSIASKYTRVVQRYPFRSSFGRGERIARNAPGGRFRCPGATGGHQTAVRRIGGRYGRCGSPGRIGRGCGPHS